MGQKLYTRWVWDGDGDEFLLWGWGWDHDTRTRLAPLPSLEPGFEKHYPETRKKSKHQNWGLRVLN